VKTITIRNVSIGEGSPKIILPLMGTTETEILQEAEKVNAMNPDIIEWRVDAYEHVESADSVKDMLSKLRGTIGGTILLFTFRSHKEGGKKKIDDRYYGDLVSTAIQSKEADFIDIELFYGEETVKQLVKEAKENGVFVVMSNHDFDQTPAKEEIVSRLRKMQEYGAHIPKIAVMPQGIEDVITLLDATQTMKEKYADRPIITMSMAGQGLISRLAGEVFGSACTFGAGERVSAPGQIPVSELKTVLEIIHKYL
jgi:3-dehydroquinate dehydratase-1